MTVPLHQLLAEDLLAQIADGRIAVGDRLPTEEQLCAQHGLARGTVRRALGRLDQLGMITRRPGAGTVVTATRPVNSYDPVAQSASDIVALAAETRLIRPEMLELKLDAATARRVGTRAGTTWFVMRGPRARRGQVQPPLCWSEHYLRADLPRGRFLEGNFTLDEVASHSVQQTISAGVLGAAIAEALAAEEGSAALIVTRRHLSRRGRLDSVGIHTHPTDRYEITTTLSAGPLSSSG